MLSIEILMNTKINTHSNSNTYIEKKKPCNAELKDTYCAWRLCCTSITPHVSIPNNHFQRWNKRIDRKDVIFCLCVSSCVFHRSSSLSTILSLFVVFLRRRPDACVLLRLYDSYVWILNCVYSAQNTIQKNYASSQLWNPYALRSMLEWNLASF